MKNGLYSIHVTLQDGRSGKGSGVVMFRDGKILGGDAYLFYMGSYIVKPGNTFKGEVLIQRHTSSPDANPLFGGPSLVGVGVSGTYTDTSAVMGRHRAGRQGQTFATLRFSPTPIRRTVTRPPPAPGRDPRQDDLDSGALPGSESRSSRPPSRVVTML